MRTPFAENHLVLAGEAIGGEDSQGASEVQGAALSGRWAGQQMVKSLRQADRRAPKPRRRAPRGAKAVHDPMRRFKSIQGSVLPRISAAPSMTSKGVSP